ncbi:MAG: ABC transporter ATP-binding protein, partial [Patescibacteria group bacterium]
LIIIKAAVLFFTNFITSVIMSNYEKDLRNGLFKSTLESSWPHLIRQKIGHLDQILTTYVTSSSGLLFGVVSAALVLTKMIVYAFVAFNLSVIITLFALALGLLTFLVFKPLFYRNRILSFQLGGMYKELAHFVNEHIIGMKTIKTMHVGRPVISRGEECFAKLKKLNISLSLTKNITTASIQPIGLIFIIAVFAFSYKTSQFDFASFVVIVYAINQIFSQLQAGQSQLHSIISGTPYLKSILDYQQIAVQNREIDRGKEKFVFNSRLDFNDISFSYNKDRNIVNKISFSIKKGQMVGIIGHSGAGKTTVADLLLRLFKASAGEIYLDGSDINNISLREWRSKVGYVAQDIFLLNDTIENNIRFYNDRITFAEIEKYAKVANIYDFISALPDKFSTIAGERGIRLSGGQRQRIILARVLAQKPELLILDEATSALDNESERQIQKAIEDLKGKITVLAIAHRLSTVKNCDWLLVLKEGEIIEQGNPRQLLKDKESYYNEMCI